MAKSQLKLGSILSYAQIAIGIVIGLLYTPIMIRQLGDSEYGLYNTVSSVISSLSILSLGFGSGYIKYYAVYKKNNDREAIYKLNGLFLIIFSIIGIIAFACGFFLSNNLSYVFDTGLTDSEYATAKVLMQLLAVNLSVTFTMSVFTNIISAHENFVFLKLLGMAKTVFGPLVTLPLLLMGYRSVAMVTVTLTVSIIADACYFIYVIFILKERFVFHDFEKGIFKNLFIYTSFIAINIIVDQINSNIGKFLLGRYHGTTAVAVYSVGSSLYHYYAMFSTAISGVFTPRIHKIINTTLDYEERRSRLTTLFTKVGRIQYLIIMLIASGLVFFGKPFIMFWAGTGYEDSYYVTLLLVIPATIPLIQNIGIEIQRALNKHRFRSIAYIIMATMTLISSIILCKSLGAIGAPIGTSLSLLIANGLIMNIYYHKKCYIDILHFWKEILRLSLGLIIPCIFGTIIMLSFEFNSLSSLAVGITSYALIYVISMWFLGMNDYEKDLIRKVRRKFLKR